MRFIYLAMAMVLLFSAVPIIANADSSQDSYHDCMDKGGVSNFEWQKCGADYVSREDTKLNIVWKRAVATASSQTKSDLLEEQRAWLSYKDEACKFFTNGEFGREGQVIHFFACKAEIINKRTRELEAYTACWTDGVC